MTNSNRDTSSQKFWVLTKSPPILAVIKVTSKKKKNTSSHPPISKMCTKQTKNMFFLFSYLSTKVVVATTRCCKVKVMTSPFFSMYQLCSLLEDHQLKSAEKREAPGICQCWFPGGYLFHHKYIIDNKGSG